MRTFTILAAALLIAGPSGTSFAAKPQARPPKPPAKAPAPIGGEVIAVHDGASFVLQADGGKTVVVRLAGVEPPESCQPGAAEARAALADRLLHQRVTAVPQGSRAGALLAAVSQGGTEMSRKVVEEGWGFSVRTHWDHGPYVKEERAARALHRGLYAGNPNVPTAAEFRRRQACAAPSQL